MRSPQKTSGRNCLGIASGSKKDREKCMKLTDRLIEAMRSEFAKSKKWYRYSLLINVVMLTVSIALVVWCDSFIAIGLGLSLFILPVALFILRELSLRHQDYAERIRRSLMMADALGLKPSDIELAQLKIDIGDIDKTEPLFDKRYYDSKLSVGAGRLVDILAESAFFTYNLSRRATWIFGALVIIGIFVLFSVLYVLFNLPISYEISLIVAKWTALVMAFLAAGDFAFLWCRYYYLSVASKDVLSKSDVLMKNNNISTEDAMKLAGDYNCAVIQSPPISGIIYQCMLTALNDAWRKRRA